MLAEEYLYTLLGNIKIFWGYPTFSGLMVDQLCLGESIADLLGILCLFRADGRPTLFGESIADLSYSEGSEGILVTFFSQTYLGTWVDRATRSLRQFLLPQFLWEKKAYEVLDNCRLINLLLVGK